MPLNRRRGIQFGNALEAREKIAERTAQVREFLDEGGIARLAGIIESSRGNGRLAHLPEGGDSQEIARALSSSGEFHEAAARVSMRHGLSMDELFSRSIRGRWHLGAVLEGHTLKLVPRPKRK